MAQLRIKASDASKLLRANPHLRPVAILDVPRETVRKAKRRPASTCPVILAVPGRKPRTCGRASIPENVLCAKCLHRHTEIKIDTVAGRQVLFGPA